MSQQTAESNEALIRSIVKNVGDNDFRLLMESLDEEVVWRSNAPSTLFRFGGVHRQRRGVQEFLAQMACEYSFSRYAADTIVATAQEVWTACNLEVRHQLSGRAGATRVASHVTLKENKIVQYEGFFDTASVLEQTGQLLAR